MTNEFIKASNEVETGEIFLALLEITHPSLATNIYLVNNNTSITSNSVVFEPYPFALSLPNDDEALPQVQLRIDNVDRSLMEVIRAFSNPPEIVLKIVLASNPNEIEIEVSHLKLRNVTYNAQTITGALVVDNPIGRNFTADEMDTIQYSGLFYA